MPRRPSAVLLLLGLVFVLGGLGLGGYGLWGYRSALADRRLESTQGTVVEVDVSKQRKDSRTGAQDPYWHVVVVSYRYRVAGQTYRSSRYAFDEPQEKFSGLSAAQGRAAALRRQVGQEGALTVLYDPDAPARSALSRREGAPALLVLALGGAAIVLGLLLFGGHVSRRRAYRRLIRARARRLAGSTLGSRQTRRPGQKTTGQAARPCYPAATGPMSDLKKSANEMTAKTAFSAAKDAAERALDDALSTEEERAARKAEEAEAKSRRRKKQLALAIVGLLIVLGVIGLVLRYWYWFLLLGVVGLVALYGRHRWRKYRAAKKAPAAEEAEAAVVAKVEVREVREVRETRDAPRKRAPLPPVEPEVDAQAIEDELAALKARVKK